MVWEIFIHFGPPGIVGVMLFLFSRKVKLYDYETRERKDERKKADDEYRAYVRKTLGIIRTQNAWVIRHFIMLVTEHNRNHPDAKVAIGDYPNGTVPD